MEVVGRKGSGPGEFRNLGGVGFAGTSVFGFVDEIGKMEVYASDTRAHLGSVQLHHDNRPASLAVMGDSLWFAGVNPRSGRALGVVAITELVGAAMANSGKDVMRFTRAVAPVPYRANHPLAMSLAHAFVDVGDDDVVLAFTATPFVLRVDRDGAVIDTIWIAGGMRRGEVAEADLLAMMGDGEQAQNRDDLRATMFTCYREVSFVRDVSRDDEGNIYTIHQDSNRDDDSNMTAVRLYVAAADAEGAWQCGDTLVPASDMGVPVPLLRGRTLWILDQRIGHGTVSDVVTVVRRFTINAARCSGDAMGSKQVEWPA